MECCFVLVYDFSLLTLMNGILLSFLAKTDDGYEMHYQVPTDSFMYFITVPQAVLWMQSPLDTAPTTYLPASFSQVNHLSPFLLTLELLPSILETASSSGDGRILFVSSGAHRRGFGASFNPENLNSEQQYDRMKTYPCTKLYNASTQCFVVV